MPYLERISADAKSESKSEPAVVLATAAYNRKISEAVKVIQGQLDHIRAQLTELQTTDPNEEVFREQKLHDTEEALYKARKALKHHLKKAHAKIFKDAKDIFVKKGKGEPDDFESHFRRPQDYDFKNDATAKKDFVKLRRKHMAIEALLESLDIREYTWGGRGAKIKRGSQEYFPGLLRAMKKCRDRINLTMRGESLDRLDSDTDDPVTLRDILILDSGMWGDAGSAAVKFFDDTFKSIALYLSEKTSGKELEAKQKDASAAAAAAAPASAAAIAPKATPPQAFKTIRRLMDRDSGIQQLEGAVKYDMKDQEAFDALTKMVIGFSLKDIKAQSDVCKTLLAEHQDQKLPNPLITLIQHRDALSDLQGDILNNMVKWRNDKAWKLQCIPRSLADEKDVALSNHVVQFLSDYVDGYPPKKTIFQPILKQLDAEIQKLKEVLLKAEHKRLAGDKSGVYGKLSAIKESMLADVKESKNELIEEVVKIYSEGADAKDEEALKKECRVKFERFETALVLIAAEELREATESPFSRYEAVWQSLKKQVDQAYDALKEIKTMPKQDDAAKRKKFETAMTKYQLVASLHRHLGEEISQKDLFLVKPLQKLFQGLSNFLNAELTAKDLFSLDPQKDQPEGLPADQKNAPKIKVRDFLAGQSAAFFKAGLIKKLDNHLGEARKLIPLVEGKAEASASAAPAPRPGRGSDSDEG